MDAAEGVKGSIQGLIPQEAGQAGAGFTRRCPISLPVCGRCSLRTTEADGISKTFLAWGLFSGL